MAVSNVERDQAANRDAQRAAAVRTALILATVALVFFVGVIARFVWLR